MEETVAGMTQYNNRQALVTDGVVNMKMSSAEIQLSASGHGYSFMDIATGAHVYSEFSMDMYITTQGNTNTFQILETTQIDLK